MTARFSRSKPLVLEMLQAPDWDGSGSLPDIPLAWMVGPLLGFLLHRDEVVRARAAALLGRVVAAMAGQDMEAARNVMRRFLWHMNEESGNVGWGIPESMAEAMVHDERLAAEYHKPLTSYIQDPVCIGDCNYLEHPPLRQGVYQGLARLAEARPELVRRAVPDLLAALRSQGDALKDEGPRAKALICRTLGLVGASEARADLEALAGRPEAVTMFRRGRLEQTTLGAMAQEALGRLARA